MLTVLVAFSLATTAAWSKDMMVLDFPSDRSIGVFRCNEPHVRHVRSPAKGRIEVPRGSLVELTVNFATASDLSPLRKLPPDALYKLDLAKLEINDDQLKNIEHLTGLHSLTLERTDVTGRGLAYLHGMKSLSILNLAETLVTGKGLKNLADLPALSSLCLRITDVGDEGLENLARVKHLQRIALARSKVTNAGLKKLSHCPELAMLDISFNSLITDAGIANLKGLKYLDDLNISNTEVTRKCLPYLKQIPSLHRVTFSKHNFNQADLAECRKQMPRCKFQDCDEHREVPLEMFAPLH